MSVSSEAPIVCLYHAECLDGTAAAWVVSQRYPEAKLIPVHYHAPVPREVVEADVILVDFCYKLPDMMQLITKAKSVLLIDHHEPTLALIDQLQVWLGTDNSKFQHRFDMGHSGALLAYMHLFEEHFQAAGVPAILKHISDRDLFEFALEDTRAVIHAVTAWGYDPAVWAQRLDEYYTLGNGRSFVNQDSWFYKDQLLIGNPIEAYHQAQIQRMTSQTMRKICFADSIVPLINVPRAYSSDALDLYTGDYPFALGYYDTDTHRVFSIRSRRGSDVRVNDLARTYGGDGHPNAAGFVVTRDHDLARL